MKEYVTIDAVSTAEYEEKHSKFIAYVTPCTTEEQAFSIIAETKSRYWDARHTVYAFALRDGTTRFSDDGEPHGTAAKPVLDVINGSGAVDVLITVTRYFGGILLGTGGLVRAYSTSARDAMANAHKVLMTPCVSCAVECEYSDHRMLSTLIEAGAGNVTDTEFTDKVCVSFDMKFSDVEAFENKLCEAFSARLTLIKKCEHYGAFEII